MAPAGYGLDITIDDLARCLVSSEVQGQQLPAFSLSATLLLTVMHHGGKDAFIRLKQVYDIALILTNSSEIDWQWLLAEARRFGCTTLLSVSAELVTLVSGTEVPERFSLTGDAKKIRRLAQNRIRRLTVPPWERRKLNIQVNDWLFRIRSRDGLTVKAGLAMRFIRKVVLPWFIPQRFHQLFMRKYIIPDYAR
jgi:hypothetical protein